MTIKSWLLNDRLNFCGPLAVPSADSPVLAQYQLLLDATNICLVSAVCFLHTGRSDIQ